MAGSFSSRVMGLRGSMSKTEGAIADYLLEHGKEACGQSILELADSVGVSKSAITRFTKALGYASLRDMRTQIATSLKEPSSFFADFEKESTLGTAQAVFEGNANSLVSTMSALDQKTLDAAVELLSRSDKCGLFGTGGSYPILFNAFHRFQRTSLTMMLQADYHMQLEIAANLSERDCALIVSHSGRNRDVIRVADILKENGVPIILITGNPLSPLAKASDLVFFSVAEETQFRPEAVTSTVSQLVLVDTLFTLYVTRVEDDPEHFARIRRIIETTRVR